MSFEFNSASRYSEKSETSKSSVPFLTGAFFLFIAFDYLLFAIRSLTKGESFNFLISLGLFAMVISSFLFLRHGIALQNIFEKSKYAKSPKYPFKTLGMLMLSGATMLSAYFGNYTLFPSLMLGFSVATGWYMYYGIDPFKDKIEGFESSKSAQRIMKIIDEAYSDIESIKRAASSISSSAISSLMSEMVKEYEKIIEHIENEPDDYESVRKYLVSYLGELKSMSEIFASLDATQRTQEVENEFKQTLKTSVEKLKKEYKKLLDEDIFDLGVKLSVMKKRFQNED